MNTLGLWLRDKYDVVVEQTDEWTMTKAIKGYHADQFLLYDARGEVVRIGFEQDCEDHARKMRRR